MALFKPNQSSGMDPSSLPDLPLSDEEKAMTQATAQTPAAIDPRSLPDLPDLPGIKEFAQTEYNRLQAERDRISPHSMRFLGLFKNRAMRDADRAVKEHYDTFKDQLGAGQDESPAPSTAENESDWMKGPWGSPGSLGEGLRKDMASVVSGAASGEASLLHPAAWAFDKAANAAGLLPKDRPSAFSRYVQGLAHTAKVYQDAANLHGTGQEIVGGLANAAGSFATGLPAAVGAIKGAGAIPGLMRQRMATAAASGAPEMAVALPAGVSKAGASWAAPVGLAALGAYQALPSEDYHAVARSAVEGLGMGGMFNVSAGLHPLLRAPVQGAGFAGLAAAGGANLNETITQGVLGAALAVPGTAYEDLVRKGAPSLAKSIADSTWYRKMTNPERALVVQDVGQQIAGMRAQGMPPDLILKNLANTAAATSPEYVATVKVRAAGGNANAVQDALETVSEMRRGGSTDAEIIKAIDDQIAQQRLSGQDTGRRPGEGEQPGSQSVPGAPGPGMAFDVRSGQWIPAEPGQYSGSLREQAPPAAPVTPRAARFVAIADHWMREAQRYPEGSPERQAAYEQAEAAMRHARMETRGGVSRGGAEAQSGEMAGQTVSPTPSPAPSSAQGILQRAADPAAVDAVVAAGSTAPIQEAQRIAAAQAQADAHAAQAAAVLQQDREQRERRGQLEQNYKNAKDRLARSSRNAGGGDQSGLTGDATGLMVTYAKQAGFSPMRVYRDLRDMGVPQPNAIREVMKGWPDFVPTTRPGALEGAEEYSLVDAIRDLGGIAPYRTHKGVRQASLHKDFSAIPLWLRNSDGTPIDEALRQLDGMGFHFETESELAAAIGKSAGRLDVERNPVKAQEEHDEEEAADHEDWEKRRSTLVPVGAMQEGDTYSVMGQIFTVVEVGDQALHVRNHTTKVDQWLPYEKVQDVRVDSGSLKRPEETRQKNLPLSAAATRPAVARAENASSAVLPDAGREAAAGTVSKGANVEQPTSNVQRPTVSGTSSKPSRSMNFATNRNGERRWLMPKARQPELPAHSTPENELHLGDQVEATLANGQPVVGTVVGADAGGNAVLQPHDGGEKVTVPEPVVGPADREQGGEHAILKRGATALDVENKPGTGAGVRGQNAEGNEVAGPRPTQEAGLSAKGEVGGAVSRGGAEAQREAKIAKARKALIPKSKKEREAEGRSQTSEKAPPEGWPVPEVLDLRIGSGQPQQMPGMAEGLTFNTYTRTDKEVPFKVVISKTSGDLGSISVHGIGKTRADAYVDAAWAFHEEVLNRTAARIKKTDAGAEPESEGEAQTEEKASEGARRIPRGTLMVDISAVVVPWKPRFKTSFPPTTLTLQADAARGDNPVWHHQGSLMETKAYAKMKDASAHLKAVAAQIEAAEANGFEKQQYRHSTLQLIWTFKKGDQLLTEDGMLDLVKRTVEPAQGPNTPAVGHGGGERSESSGLNLNDVDRARLAEIQEKLRARLAGGKGLTPGVKETAAEYGDWSPEALRWRKYGEELAETIWRQHMRSVRISRLGLRRKGNADYQREMDQIRALVVKHGVDPVRAEAVVDGMIMATLGAHNGTEFARMVADRVRQEFPAAPIASGVPESSKALPEEREMLVLREAGASYAAAASAAFDPESATLAGEMATLYAKGGMTKFAEFAAAVKRDMPDAWDGISRYLHGAWVTAGTGNPELDEVSRAQAAEAIGAVSGGEVSRGGPTSPEATPRQDAEQSSPIGYDSPRAQSDAGGRSLLQSSGPGGTLSTEGGKQSGRSLMPPARGGTDNGRVQTTLPKTDASAASPGVGGAGKQTPSGQGSGGGGDDSLRLRGGRGGESTERQGRTSIQSGGSSGARQESVGTGSDATSVGGAVGVGGGEHGIPERGDRVGAGGAGPGIEGRSPSAGGSGTAGAVAGVDSNYRITAADDFGGTGAVTKARANLAALRLLKKLNAEGRPATTEEKTALARYVGWGNSSLKNTMFPLSGRESVLPEAGSEESSSAATFRPLAQELRDLLTPEEYETARRSVQYAHYTAPAVVRAMWSAVQRLGFDGGRVLEPGSGVGRFVGLIPDDLIKPGRVRFTGVEMDGVSAGISRLLYPKADMRHGDFVEFPYLGEVFDLAIGNPPFSERRVTADPRYAKDKMVLHDYFIRKSLDQVKPGGLVVLVTSHGTMDKKNDATREMIAKHADLLGAIRLPQSAFYKDAGTKVVTDILFLRKRFPGQEPGGESWQVLGSVPTDDGEAWVNEYYAAHPEMVLGTHSLAGRMRFGGGKEYTVLPLPDTGGGIEGALEKAVWRLPELRARPPAKTPAGEGEVSRGGAGAQSGKVQGELPVTGADDTARTLAVAPGQMLDGGYNLLGNQLVLTDGGVHTPVLPNSERPKKGALTLSPDAGAQPPVYVSKEQIGVIKHYMPLRDAVRRVLSLQTKGTDSELAAAQQEMARAYRLFTLAHGPINQRKVTLVEDADGKPVMDEHGHQEEKVRWPIKDFIDQDVFHGAVLSLEVIDDNGKFTGKLAKLFTERVIGVPPETKIETPADALGVVMREQGRPDLAAVASLLGVSEADAEKALAGRVYRDPESGNWLVAEKYLSGNVKEKLEQARAKAATDPSYQANVKALEAAQPAELPPSRIKLNLGMPVIPPADIEQFMREVGGVGVRVSYNKHVGSWLADDVHGDGPVSVATRSARMSRFGTQERTAAKILTSALNGKPIQVTETDPDGTVHVLPEATAAANQKVSELLEGWNSWVFADPGRMQRLSKAFNDTFNVWRNENWNGDHLTFPGMSKEVNPYPHQKGLAWRVIQQGNTYAVHEVGLGKTMAAAMTAMELRRLGLAKKIMVVVPNHMLGQWNSDFHKAYPAASILLADEDQFTPKRRQRFLGRIVNGDHDAIVITHSAFKLIDVGAETQKKHIGEEIERFRRALEDGIGRSSAGGAGRGKRGRGGDKQDPRRKQIELSIEKLEDRLKALSNMRRDKGLVWDNLGVDQLIVDEAHEYRKLRFATTRRGLKGIDPDGSERSWDLYMKGRTITDRTPGRGLLFLSGTPIVNTMGEVFTVQRMMQQRELDKLGVGMFDPWVTTFGAPETKFEKTPGKGYASVTRLAHWMNMTLLSGMWQQIGDYRRFDDLPYMKDRRPTVKGGSMQPIVVTESPAQKTYREKVIEERIKAIRKRHGKPQKGEDIILSVITDAKHAAMDERFISPSLGVNPDQKLEQLARDVVRIYREGKADRRTQLVFMDLGLPGMVEKRGFSAYLRLREALIAGGIPSHEIAFKNDFKKRSDMDRLQEMMNDGQMRVLIGSMQAMGTGLNVQKRLFKAHFVTIPWYPALVEQAVGRIVRQGNMFPEVELAAYMTAGTIEEYMWGLNETKSRWIHGFFRGAVDEMGGELDSESDTYALLRCLSSADPRVQQLAELQAKLAKIQMLERAHLDTQSGVMSDIRTTGYYIASKQDHVAFLKALPKPPDTTGDAFSMTVGDKTYTDRGEAGSALLQAAVKVWAEDWKTDPKKPAVKIGSFGSGYDVDASKYLDDMLYVNLTVDVPGVGGKALHVVTGSPSSPLSSKGVLQSLEGALRSVNTGKQLQETQREILSLQESLKEVKGRLSPWTRGDEANKLRRQIQDLQAEIAKDSKDDEEHPQAGDDVDADASDDDADAVHETPGEYNVGGRSLLPRPKFNRYGLRGTPVERSARSRAIQAKKVQNELDAVALFPELARFKTVDERIRQLDQAGLSQTQKMRAFYANAWRVGRRAFRLLTEEQQSELLQYWNESRWHPPREASYFLDVIRRIAKKYHNAEALDELDGKTVHEEPAEYNAGGRSLMPPARGSVRETPGEYRAGGRSAPVFYSALGRAVEGMNLKQAIPGDQFLNKVRGLPGVKAQEIEETGFADWLNMQKEQGKAVTKEAAAAFLKENGVQVETVNKHGPLAKLTVEDVLTLRQAGDWPHGEVPDRVFDAWEKDPPTWEQVLNKLESYGVEDPPGVLQKIEDGWAFDTHYYAGDVQDTSKFSDYAPVGGVHGTYREVLLRLPDVEASRLPPQEVVERVLSELQRNGTVKMPDGSTMSVKPDGTVSDPYGTSSLDSVSDFRKSLESGDWGDFQRPKAEFISSHWSESNVLAHMLMDDREIPLDILAQTHPELAARLKAQGKTVARALHMIEGQSDLHQAGAVKGYQEKSIDTTGWTATILIRGSPSHGWYVFDKTGAAVNRPTEQRGPSVWRGESESEAITVASGVLNKAEGVPALPMRGDAWKRLVIRKMLAEAVDGEYDLLTWSTGADRLKKWGSQRVDWKINSGNETDARYSDQTALARYVDRGQAEDEDEKRRLRSYYADTHNGDLPNDAQLMTWAKRVKAELGKAPKGTWTVSAQEQHGGTHDGQDIEAMARERGVLLESKGRTVRTKEDLRRVIESIKRGDETNVEKMTDRIWDRMQVEPEGTSLPRKEFFEFLYDKSFVQEANDIVRRMDKSSRVMDLEVPLTDRPEPLGAKGMPVHAIPITDSMRSSIAQGQALYESPGSYSAGKPARRSMLPPARGSGGMSSGKVAEDVEDSDFDDGVLHADNAIVRPPEQMEFDLRRMHVVANNWGPVYHLAYDDGETAFWGHPDKQVDFLSIDEAVKWAKDHGASHVEVPKETRDFWASLTPEEVAAYHAEIPREENSNAVREPVGVAYHGTPHTFEPEPSAPLGRFKKEKVGTGEGAAAYGWGVAYVAQNPQVAKQYVEDLRGMFYDKTNPAYKTRDAAKFGEDVVGGEDAPPLDDARMAGIILGRQLQDREPIVMPENANANMQRAYRILVQRMGWKPGNLYHVEVTADREHLLDWDRPLREQSKTVQNALEKALPIPTQWEVRQHPDGRWGVYDADSDRLLDGLYQDRNDALIAERSLTSKEIAHALNNEWQSGRSMYDALSTVLGSARKASERLASLGVRGIQYEDQGSRFRKPRVDFVYGTKDGKGWMVSGDNNVSHHATKEEAETEMARRSAQKTYNFVIFDENDIRVVGRNGKILTPTQAVKEAQAEYAAGQPARSMLPLARVGEISTTKAAKGREGETVRETPARSMLPAPRSVLSVPDVVSRMEDAVRKSLGAQADHPEAKAAIESLKVSIPQAMAASDKPYQMELWEHDTTRKLARFKRSEAQKMGRQRREDAARDARIEEMRKKLERLRVDHPEMWHRSAIDDAMGTTGEGRLPLTLHEAVWKVPRTPLYLSHPEGYRIHSPRDIAALTWALRTPTHERFVVCAIDKGGKLLAARVVSVGLLDASLVSPSIVFGWLPAGTVAISCTHNHPSGDPTPSSEDIKITRQLVDAGHILGIPVVDHVTTDGRYISLKDAGISSLSFPLRPYRSKPNTPENELPGPVKEDEKYVTDPYGVVSENYNLAEWEVIPSTMLPGVHLPGQVRKVVEPVERSAEPGKWVHVVFLNTKNKTLAVERVAGDRSGLDIGQRVLRSAMEVPGVASIAVTFNWHGQEVDGMVQAIERMSSMLGIRVLDYLDHAYLSRGNDRDIWNKSTGLAYDPSKAAVTVNGEITSAAAEKVAENAGEYSTGMVRETPASYGNRSSEYPVGPDGEPDWDRYAAELRQKYAAAVQAEQELRRVSPRRIEITRAIERDKMSRLSREMSSLRRRVAKADEAKAAAKEKGKVLQAQAVKTVARMAADEWQKMFGSSLTRGETLNDLLREIVEIGRQKGLAQKSRRDIRSAIRDALNERTKRLMAHSDLPTNWNEITASRNANMLAALNQIRESMKSVPADQRVGAAAAEVRRLLGGGKDVDEAISGLAPGDYESLLTGTGDALARDLRAYYRREIGRLFGGRPTTVTLPSGDVARRKTVGVVHAGLSRMTDEPRAAMKEIIDNTPWDSLNTLTWEELRSIVDRAKRYLSEDQANKEFIKEGHKIRRADASDAAAREIEAAREPLEASRTASPEHGTWSQRQAWSRCSPGTQALLLTGGDEEGAAYVVLSGNLIDANDRQLNLEARDNLALEEKMKGLGFTRDDLLRMDYVLESVDLPGGRTVELTRGEMMTLYGIMQDADAREKVLHNGWLPSRRRHVESKYIVRGEGKTYEERLADSEAIVQAVVGRLTPAERTVVEWMTHEMANEWGRRANETSRIVAGVSLFGDGPHFTLAGSIAREAELPNVDDPAGLQQHMVDRWGGAKERQAHSNAIFLRPFLSVFRQQARDMSTYTAWAVPYRDAISMLSRGPAKSAIVERWGTTVLGDMKDSLAYLTYQKGHTDDYTKFQRALQVLERNASAHILGASLTTIAKNRYAGALDMAKMISVEGGDNGPELARKYLARVLAPAVGMERTRDPARLAIKDRLMKEGYFWDRWGRHAFRVFGQLSSQRMEVDERRRMLPTGRDDATDPMKRLRRSQGWKDFQTLMLSGMQHAEVANAIDAWQTLEAAGWTPEKIIPAVIRWTRRTQNPSTPLEHSYQYTWVRKSGGGVIVPFLGQPSVVTDQWQAEALKAKKTGNWKRLALFRFGTLAALAMSVLIGLLYRRAQKNMLGAGNPSDKKEAREAFNTVNDALGQAAQLVNPVVGGRVVGWGLPTLWAMVIGDKSMIPQGATDESLLGGIVSEYNNATRLLVKGLETGEITQVQVEKLAISTHRLAGELTGLPTGGIEKGVRAAAGALGEPIGVAEDKETVPKSGIGSGYKRPKPLMPAARRKQ